MSGSSLTISIVMRAAILRKAEFRLAVLAAALALLAPVAPVFAQGAATTYLSSTGDDDNDCATPATSCEGFGRANNQTMVGGTILVLDSDSYGSGSITRSLNIVAQGAAGVISFAASGGPNFAALSINTAASDVVTIRGLTLGGNSHSYAGVNFLGAGALHLEDCAIHDNHTGVHFRPTGASELYVTNCTIGDNRTVSTEGGIVIKPTGSGVAKAVIDNVNVENNSTGIIVDGRTSAGTHTVTIRNSTIVGNTAGVFAVDSGAGATTVTIEESTSANNGSFGIGANGANATVRVRDTIVTGNANGLVAAAGSSLVSLGGNNVVGNTVNGAFTSTLPQQ